MKKLSHITESTLKNLFAAIPFAGQPLNEIFYDFRGRVKQERLNSFNEFLSAYFSQYGPINFGELNAVQFSDLFESIVLRVAHTGSREKHRRFRDILVGYIEHPEQKLDFSDAFLELVAVLNEPAIQILKYHVFLSREFERLRHLESAAEVPVRQIRAALAREEVLEQQGLANNVKKLRLELEPKLLQLQAVQTEENELSKYRKAEFYGLSEEEFLYLKQILLSRALLTDSGVGHVSHIPFFYMNVTAFAKQFILYIREGNNDQLESF